MAPETIHLPLSLSLLLLLLSLLLPPAGCDFYGRETRIQRFWRFHVDNPKSFIPGGNRKYCTVMIRRRQISERGKCKRENTFIHAMAGAILDVCKAQSVKACKVGRKNCHTSDHCFKQTLCVLQGFGYYPNCAYVSFPKYKKISLACTGLPRVPVYVDP
ncbi:ribonuclease pancreatic-like [Gracilinanus agilis]|uniref:ribonuclease pancreatic-like n=1 Tax=Gracilinanus agilis TaxID=191870 RepID=UPI001CFEB684|nr:ribonuclease pancreatic-like [Gracilinanus agilis]